MQPLSGYERMWRAHKTHFTFTAKGAPKQRATECFPRRLSETRFADLNALARPDAPYLPFFCLLPNNGHAQQSLPPNWEKEGVREARGEEGRSFL